MAAFKISKTSRLEPLFRVTDLPHRSDPAARGERDSHSAGWMSTACALRRVFSSFGLNSLGRSAESDERHPACQNPPGGRGFSVAPLVLFSSRDISPPRQAGRWLNQQPGHQLVFTAPQLFYVFCFLFFLGGAVPSLPLSLQSVPLRSRLWEVFIFRTSIFGRARLQPLPAPTRGPPDVKQVGAERRREVLPAG